MKRREFIALIGGAAVAWPLAARAQQPERMKRIGVLMFYADNDHEGQKRVAAFREELQNLGWEEGRNIQIESHWYMGDVEKARASAAELVRLTPDVIVANGAAGLEKLQQATRTIPIVFTLIGEPVARGFVQSLAHPGGNITGFTNLEATTAAKWIELIKEIAPSVKRVAIIYNPATSPFASPLCALGGSCRQNSCTGAGVSHRSFACRNRSNHQDTCDRPGCWSDCYPGWLRSNSSKTDNRTGGSL